MRVGLAPRWFPRPDNCLRHREETPTSVGGSEPYPDRVESELQKITDGLGSQLSRSVAIDDCQMRLLAYSPHYGPVDDVRLASILHRVCRDEHRKYALTFGIEKATAPVKVLASEEHGLLLRWCVPVTHRGLSLGYLWLIDADGSITSDDLAEASAAADAAGAALYRGSLIEEIERGRERELLRDLLATEPAMRQLAASQLVDEELFVPAGEIRVLVVRGIDFQQNESIRVAFDAGLTESRRRLPGRRSLHLTRLDHGLLVVDAGRMLATAAAQLAFADEVRADILRNLDVDGTPSPAIGIGDSYGSLVDVAKSYEQAKLAARVAEVIQMDGNTARWADLGVYRAVARLPVDELSVSALEPGIVRLLEMANGETLIRTLECYLDLAGSAKRTAEALHLHRASLYGRLAKTQEITGLDLENGNDRLALHLGLKIARLAGVHPDEGTRK